MYIMFPIGIMYYFGTNLDSRFSTPDFWPKPGETHTIPFEKEDIKQELERLRARRLAVRAQRLEMENQDETTNVVADQDDQTVPPKQEILEAARLNEPERSQIAKQKGWSSWIRWSKE